MFRELSEELGLKPDDVEVLALSKQWMRYRLPKQFRRHWIKPLVIGQRQKWFLLQLQSGDKSIRFDLTNSPEFDEWDGETMWVGEPFPVTEASSSPGSTPDPTFMAAGARRPSCRGTSRTAAVCVGGKPLCAEELLPVGSAAGPSCSIVLRPNRRC